MAKKGPKARAYHNLTEKAHEVGVPPDQLANFVAGKYVPQPMQLRFHAAARLCDSDGGPLEVGLGGARGPGKSHASFAQIALDDCQRQPGLRCLYLRKVGKKAREQFNHLRKRVLHSIPHSYKSAAGVVSFDNGSTIITGHFRSENDIDDYLGMEYGAIVVEEATTLSKTKIQAIRDSCRSAITTWRPRIYMTTNPGGVGHAWFKNTFILPWRNDEEEETRFIFGTVEDNAFIDDTYRVRLEQNTGWRLRAYRYGDWDISAGQYFTTFITQERAKKLGVDSHVTEPFEMPGPGWTYWGALDYGMAHFTFVLLFAMTGDGFIYVVDEYKARNTLTPANARGIKAMLARHGLTVRDLYDFVAGPDLWARRGTARTIAQRYRDEGIEFTRAKTDRIAGWAECMEQLGDPVDGIPPNIAIFNRCGSLINCISSMQHDPNRPEDVLKVDADDDDDECMSGDDPADAWRYGLMAAPGAGGLQVGTNPTAGYRG